MTWIPTEWMNPDETGAYLVTVKQKGMFGTGVLIGQWDQPSGQLRFDSENKGRWKWMAQEEVIAWMPLPEPFKTNEHGLYEQIERKNQ